MKKLIFFLLVTSNLISQDKYIYAGKIYDSYTYIGAIYDIFSNKILFCFRPFKGEFESAVSGEEPSILLFTFPNSFARSFAMAHFLFCNSLQPSSTQPNDVFLNAVRQHCAIFMEFFRILTGSLATCLETSRGGAEFSKPYSEEEHQERGITLGLHYVISSEPSAVNSVLDSYLLTILKKEEMLCLRSLLAHPKIVWRL